MRSGTSCYHFPEPLTLPRSFSGEGSHSDGSHLFGVFKAPIVCDDYTPGSASHIWGQLDAVRAQPSLCCVLALARPFKVLHVHVGTISPGWQCVVLNSFMGKHESSKGCAPGVNQVLLCSTFSRSHQGYSCSAPTGRQPALACSQKP